MSSSSPQDESDFTLAQQVAITLVPAFSGTLSIIGSSCIIWMLMAENRKKLKSVKYRIIFALCLSDVINSLWFVFYSLPIPKGTPGVWGAMGNYVSCNAMGFFLQFGIIGSFYNGALSLYFYKSLCFNMKDEQIAKRYEKWIHIGCLVWPLGTAIAAWQQDLYSYSGMGCWIAPEPLRCHRRDDVDCIRGEDAYIYAWVYTGIPLILLCMCIVFSMVKIYMKVKEISRRAELWSKQWSDRNINDRSLQSQTSSQRGSISSNDKRDMSGYAERTKEVAWQAFLYVIAYVVTHLWAFVVVNIELGGGTTPFALVLIQNLCWPLQGFANVFVFLRPRIRSIRKSNFEMSYFTAAYHSVFHYDELHRVSSKPANSLARKPKNLLSFLSGNRKSSGEGSDTFDVSAPYKMGDSRQQEESIQPVIHEEAPAQHDADEQPTITEETITEGTIIEDALFVQSTEPKESPHKKEDNVQQVVHEEVPDRDADEQPTSAEDALFAQSTG
jgi:hypothetical protein